MKIQLRFNYNFITVNFILVGPVGMPVEFHCDKKSINLTNKKSN
jgi:hypothetical protein